MGTVTEQAQYSNKVVIFLLLLTFYRTTAVAGDELFALRRSRQQHAVGFSWKGQVQQSERFGHSEAEKQ